MNFIKFFLGDLYGIFTAKCFDLQDEYQKLTEFNTEIQENIFFGFF
jgi:hypothetical protein